MATDFINPVVTIRIRFRNLNTVRAAGRLQRTPAALVCPVAIELREVEAMHRLNVLLAHAFFPVPQRLLLPLGVKFSFFLSIVICHKMTSCFDLNGNQNRRSEVFSYVALPVPKAHICFPRLTNDTKCHNIIGRCTITTCSF